MLKRVQDHPEDIFEAAFSVGPIMLFQGVPKSTTLLTGIQLFNFVLFLHALQAQAGYVSISKSPGNVIQYMVFQHTYFPMDQRSNKPCDSKPAHASISVFGFFSNF